VNKKLKKHALWSEKRSHRGEGERRKKKIKKEAWRSLDLTCLASRAKLRGALNLGGKRKEWKHESVRSMQKKGTSAPFVVPPTSCRKHGLSVPFAFGAAVCRCVLPTRRWLFLFLPMIGSATSGNQIKRGIIHSSDGGVDDGHMSSALATRPRGACLSWGPGWWPYVVSSQHKILLRCLPST